MTNIEIAKAQVEFVKKELLRKKLAGENVSLVIAEYSKEEYGKFLPEENWDEYVECQFLFIHFLTEENLNNKVVFQHIDWEGFQKFAAEKGLKNDGAARSWYAVVKHWKENLSSCGNVIEFKDVLFKLKNCGENLEITAEGYGLQPSGCFVRKDGEIYGHYGYFDGGFADPDVERFSQEVFNKEIAEWCAEK